MDNVVPSNFHTIIGRKFSKVECALYCIYYIVATKIVWNQVSAFGKNAKRVYFFINKQYLL